MTLMRSFALVSNNVVRMFAWKGTFPREDVWTSACEMIKGKPGDRIIGPIFASNIFEAFIIAQRIVERG